MRRLSTKHAKCNSLEELWDLSSDLVEEKGLAPIPGNGKLRYPKIMFVFINPTGANVSAKPSWRGPRFPFAGTKRIWRIFSQAGIFDKELLSEIESSAEWSVALAEKVLNHLKERDFYFTNVVKETSRDAMLPSREKIRKHFPILEREIELVRPRRIVSFGLIPFESLTKKKIKLGDYYREFSATGELKAFDAGFGKFKAKVTPCYFPVGRGNPARAVEILKAAARLP